MAQKVQVILIDDIDGSEADETIEFGLDGSTYTIDLTTEKAEGLREALKQYVESGRRIGGGKRAGKPSARRTNTDYDPSAVRAWARSRNIEVSERGRIQQAVLDAYREAGN